MISKLVNLNFKSTDGVTRFFKYGILSKGVVIDPEQEAALRRVMYMQYPAFLIPVLVTIPLIGPAIGMLLLPGFLLWYWFCVNGVLVRSESDRITMAEHWLRLSDAIPRWLLLICVSIGLAFVAIGSWATLTELLALRRASRLGYDYHGPIMNGIAAVVFFGVVVGLASSLLTLKRVKFAPVKTKINELPAQNPRQARDETHLRSYAQTSNAYPQYLSENEGLTVVVDLEVQQGFRWEWHATERILMANLDTRLTDMKGEFPERKVRAMDRSTGSLLRIKL